MFIVPKCDGEHRLVIDMRPISKYFPHCKVSYETLSWLSDAPRQTVAAANVNVSSGYHHLRLHSELQQYLCFQMEGEYYCCVALPFGWSLAPAFFTKLMQLVVAALREPVLLLLPPSWPIT